MKVTPESYARELGLKFKVEEPAKSNMKVQRFTFEFPPMQGTAKPSNRALEATKELDAPENASYVDTVQRVTQWAEKMRPWMFLQPGAGHIVAAELTWGNRFRVAMYNRKNKKLQAAFWSDEANARRLALTQPTPEQGIKLLMETPRKEKETRKLLKLLQDAAEVVAAPEPVVPVTAYSYQDVAREQAERAAQASPSVFVSSQGTDGVTH